ncbi:flagellar filament capping protein FliD [Undibacterium curvum]|uniref:flagellar filament capping protein FliD n=1 Tax=Undibacterium curvum TaxID=2762294 RepID=UPI003D11153B
MASIQSLGIGSGLDVNGLISKIMQGESTPLISLAKKQASYQANLTAFGTVNGALSSLQTALATLNNGNLFKNLNASVSDSSVASASTNSTAVAGSYNINISKIAQAQTISSAGQVSTTTPIGTGASTTLSFQFGTITGTAASGVYTGASFEQDATQATGTVTIDSTNNSLQGIRDAINAAKIGVQASIVGDGSATPYHLVLNSSKTGATSSMKITTTGDSALANLMNYDPAGTQNFKEVATAQSANMTVNGIAVTSASNSVSTAIQGVTITAQKVGTTSLNLTANTTQIQSGITAFVTAYNSVNSTISSVTAYNPSTKTGGALLGNATVQSVQNQIRNVMTNSVAGLGGGLTNLAQLGITFQKDGSLAVDSTKLQAALSANFSDVAGLFAAAGKTTDSLTSFVGSTSNSKPGSYAVNVTQLATQGKLTGTLNLNSGSTTIASGTTMSFSVDGVAADVNLTAGTYTATQLASMIQSAVNGTSGFSSKGINITASVGSDGFLNLTSGTYGTTSNISIANKSGTGLDNLTGTVTAGVPGKNVAGTLNGVTAVGSGQFLTGASGSDSSGIQILVSGGSTGDRGNVNFSQGYAFNLTSTLSNFLGSSGTITNATNGINSSIKDLQKQTEIINKRLVVTQARYQAQFAALDKVVNSMTATQNFLTQQINVLNGTRNR